MSLYAKCSLVLISFLLLSLFVPVVKGSVVNHHDQVYNGSCFSSNIVTVTTAGDDEKPKKKPKPKPKPAEKPVKSQPAPTKVKAAEPKKKTVPPPAKQNLPKTRPLPKQVLPGKKKPAPKQQLPRSQPQGKQAFPKQPDKRVVPENPSTTLPKQETPSYQPVVAPSVEPGRKLTPQADHSIIEQSRSNVALPPSPSIALLSVFSDPVGAEVRVDSRLIGTTPLINQPEIPGRRVVAISKQGFQTHRQLVDFIENKESELVVTLQENQQVSLNTELAVTSVPDGASVSWNGESIGLTPLSFKNLSNDLRDLRGILTVQKDGFQTYQEAIQLSAQTINRFSIQLQPWTGSLEITANVSGASISLDGGEVGIYNGNPLLLEEVPAGEHEIIARMDGFQQAVRTVTVEAGRTSQVAMELILLSEKPGILLVESIPTDAEVYIDNEATGYTTPATISLQQGEYLVSAWVPGYDWAHETVRVPPGVTVNVYLTLYSDDNWLIPSGSYPFNPGLWADTNESPYIASSAVTASRESYWEKTFGGGELDEGRSMTRIYDDHYKQYLYVFAGFQDKGKDRDALLMKLSRDGRPLWERSIEARGWDEARFIQATYDKGLIMAGITAKEKDGETDAWLVKLDAMGSPEWSRTYGDQNNNGIYSVTTSLGGGYLAAGYTVDPFSGKKDGLLINTREDGQVQWSNRFGGKEDDELEQIVRLDSTYILVGSYGREKENKSDIWLIRLDKQGQRVWSRTYGGKRTDRGVRVVRTYDRGYLLLGNTESFGQGQSDVWLLKVDSLGVEQWSQSYGSSAIDEGTDLVALVGSSFLLTGYSQKRGEDVDAWLTAVDSTGKVLWSRTYGGLEDDRLYDIEPLQTGGYLLTGVTASNSSWPGDAWIIKTDMLGQIVPESLNYSKYDLNQTPANSR